VTCSRTIAVIYYLTKGWQPEYGGLLVDMEAQGGGPKTYVPEVRCRATVQISSYRDSPAGTTHCTKPATCSAGETVHKRAVMPCIAAQVC
jgi:hypothetical protein